MELLPITRKIHCKAVEQRAIVDTQTIQPGLGGLRTLDPLLTHTSLSPCYKILAAPLAVGDADHQHTAVL